MKNKDDKQTDIVFTSDIEKYKQELEAELEEELVRELLNEVIFSRNIMISFFYIDFFGDINCALFFNHLLCPDPYEKYTGDWICISYDDWYNEVRLIKKTAMRVKRILKMKGLIQTKEFKEGGETKFYYKINMENYKKSVMQYIYRKPSRRDAL